MEKVKLACSLRKVVGKKTSSLRRQGIAPIHLFGRDMESLTLQCDVAQLERAYQRVGRTRPIELDLADHKQAGTVFIRDIQRDPIKRRILHADFYMVRKGEKIKLDIPLVFVGEAPAMKAKGRILTQPMSNFSIECLPDNIPSQIEVDISSLTDLDKAILVKDVPVGEGITVNEDPEQLVVKVSEMAEERVEVPVKPVAEAKVEAEAEAAAPKAEAAAKEAPEAKK